MTQRAKGIALIVTTVSLKFLFGPLVILVDLPMHLEQGLKFLFIIIGIIIAIFRYMRAGRCWRLGLSD
jgi:hypothetical protein